MLFSFSTITVLSSSKTNDDFYTEKATFDNFDFFQKRKKLLLFRLGLNSNLKKYFIPYKLRVYFDYQKYYHEVLRVEFYKKDDTFKKSVTFHGYDISDTSVVTDIANISYENGDYIKINFFDDVVLMTANNLHYNSNNFDYEKNRLIIKNNKFVLVEKKDIILEGIEPITIKQGENIDLMKNVKGYSITDGDVSNNIVFWGNFNKDNPGVYDIHYSVSDKMKKMHTFTRKITVTSAPVRPKYEANRKKLQKAYNTQCYFKDYKEKDNYFRVVFIK